ncbi:MAG: hypothetical protein JWM12_2502 [Ilumatobacteraceae bacterium]|nr:hypothetical protein [Ilumatobacteraceae bacterium]
MESRRIRGVLFDFGHTLFAHATLTDTVRAAGARLGLPIDPDEAARLAAQIDALALAPSESVHARDLDAEVWAARWAAIYGCADDRHPGLGPAIDAAMHDADQWVPYVGTAAVLAGLHAAQVRVGVISNTGWDVRRPFAVRGLDVHVDAFTLSYEVGVAKPDPRIFASACVALGLEPADVLMVGDDARADVGGVALGIRTVLLPPGPPGSDNGIGAVLGFVSPSPSRSRSEPFAPTGATTA